MNDEERIAAALAAYDLGTVRDVRYHAGTAAKTWRVGTDRGAWLLRTRGSRTSTDALIAFDHGLRAHLANAGIPTATPVPTRAGKGFVRVDGLALEVYPLLPGHTIGEASLEQVAAAARMLAAFHRAARDYGGDVPPATQYRTVGVDAAAARLEPPDLLAAVYARLDGEAGAAYAPARAAAARWLQRLEAEFPDATYWSLPQTTMHGDFTLANLLFAADDTVCGVFDFDWSRRGPRIRDVADGMFFVAGRRRTPLVAADIWSLTEAADLQVERCAAWLNAYQEAEALTAAERVTLPLALAARWLSVRVEGMAKVPAEERLRFAFGNLPGPLDWLDRQAPWLTGR